MKYDDIAAKADEIASEKTSASTKLVEIAMSQYSFGVSTLGETFAIPKSGPAVVSMLRGSKMSLRGLLAREYFRIHRKAAPQQALADALLVVEGLAQEGDEAELHFRVAQHDDDLWLDIGDTTGRAIRITASGWSVESSPPMLFRRTVLNGSLPDPVAGDLDELWQWLNVAPEYRPLIVAWIVAALFPGIPHPVLSFQGEHGTAKTTAMKMSCSIIDPSPVISRKPPRDTESWVTAAAGSWVVGIDNLSHVPDWLSDSICRAVTGDGDVRRKLYTDGEHAVFAFRRCVCITSIDLGTLRGDLADRMLPIALNVIPESRRMKESDVMEAWSKAHPKVLGAILDVAAGVIRALPSVALASMPRMADFAEIVAAADMVLGTDGLSRYLSLSGEMARDAIASDVFLQAVESLGAFEGTSSDLYKRVTPEKPPKDWPKDARAVTTLLRRQAPGMRKTGWHVEDDGGRNEQKVLRWTLRPPEMARNQPPSSPSSPSLTGVTGVTGIENGTSTYDETCRACGGNGDCEWCDR
jgi:hypothetical protein